MSAAINQFGLHTVEYSIRKKLSQDPLYSLTHPEQPASYDYAHGTHLDTCLIKEQNPLSKETPSFEYYDQLSKNIWTKPYPESPTIYKKRPGEWFQNDKLKHTLEANTPYYPYHGYVDPTLQNKWEDDPSKPPKITKQNREQFPVVLSTMTRYVEEMNAMEFGFKLY
ncbi:unnamed protein product [Didymodactylos carnosus]|uniref:Uncharacterized protein n=1 Tax=Didymodactylos carnosus TaxID=1234261 RepID=A0A815C107_9BILA|nr:unnamed protein product [Didymodactylos carnosus]CAF1277607.1 unnamed protein product [Didymodactylos carnosus]CAF3554907.1 unnamed protein product [Didymodactylos carnosus]CAF4070557.1 unnamed protein product [Didymodactylos carnosus]